MGETTGQIEQHIRETREQLGDNLNELEEKVKTAVDWRAQFEERPGTMMALAFGGGLVLAALLPGGRSSRRVRYAEGDGNETATRNARTFNSSPATDTRTSGNLGALKGALIGLATTKLADFVEDLVPGFQQEFTRAQDSQRTKWPDTDGQSWPHSSAAAD